MRIQLLPSSFALTLALGFAGAYAGTTTNGAPAHRPPSTPIVDPIPVLEPVYLPLAMRKYDPRLPDALAFSFDGYVTALNREGRQTCAPATHLLLSAPEGTPGNKVIAALYSTRRVELDFYVNLCVHISGPVSLTSTACQRGFTWQLVDVTSINDKGICALSGGR